MGKANWIEEKLRELQAQHLDRRLSVQPEPGGEIRDCGQRILNLSSNDYLNLVHHPTVIGASREALESYGSGSGASRLVCGTLPVHEELEAALARYKGYPTSLVFGSGYLTNLGMLPALAGRDDIVFVDRLAHACILDGARLSGATLRRYRHNDMHHLEELLREASPKRRRVVVTESVFSMDGDLAPLPDLARICTEHDATLLVDEAHATGVFGPGGSGLIREHGLEDHVELSMGTLSKAFGSYGGYVACSDLLRQWFINRSRTFIYATALPPAVIGASIGAMQVLQEEPYRGARLLQLARRFRNRVQEEGLDTMTSESQIIPILIGDADQTVRVSSRLRQDGILAVAIRPPTVPAGTARLRISVTYAHTDEDLELAANAIARAIREEAR